MVFRCIVPQCRGNYDKNGIKVSTFAFPKDQELCRKWIAAIPRDFKVTKNTRVCELHFTENDIRRFVEYVCDKTGKKTQLPLEQPRLNKEAVPSIFLGCPKYLSSTKCSREDPETKRRKYESSQLQTAVNNSLQTYEEDINKYKVESIQELFDKKHLIDLPTGFNLLSDSVSMTFIKINVLDFIPHYLMVIVDQNLFLKAFNDKVCLKKIDAINFPVHIKDVQQISSILSNLDKFSREQCTTKENIKSIILNLLDMLKSMCNENENLVITFIKEQVSLIFTQKNQNRYSSDLLIIASLILSISPHAYNFLRNSDILILPHPSTIKKLFTSCNLNPKLENTDENFLMYIKEKFKYLSDKDKAVILMMDEIHLKPYFDFKGGNILGMSLNGNDAANSAYAFMVQSVQSTYKDVVAIMPVKTLNADILHEFVKKVLIGLEKIGFHTFCVISDNNSLNRKAISMFISPPKLQIVYPHPYDNKKCFFFMIDSVHIIKCVRNNWINQKNYNCCMFYPGFPSDEIQSEERLKTASFQALRKFYEYERLNLVKFAHTLNTKSLFPTNIERQNVKLALNIFNKKLVEALRAIGEQPCILDIKSTADYIEIFSNWFEVMNVKTLTKGMNKLNIFQEPLRLDDFRFQFLDKFLVWLDTFKNAPSDTGHLTPETHTALTITTYAMREISRYCTEELQMNFVLTGKFQTDILEDRFGKYRQLAGGQYDISVTQLYETETKLRVQSTLPLILKSPTIGEVKVTIQNSDSEDEFDDIDSVDIKKFDIKVLPNDLEQIKSVMPVLVYIAGYSVHSVLKYIKNCTYCKLLLTVNKEISYQENNVLINHQDRGGLKHPTDDVVSAVSYTYIIITKLLSDYEGDFLKVHNQRKIAMNIVNNVLLSEKKTLNFETCLNKHSSVTITKCIIKKVTNTLLNNYCKKKNDKTAYLAHSKAKQRKMKTLQK